MLARVITSIWDMWHTCFIVDPSSETVSVMTVILLWLYSGFSEPRTNGTVYVKQDIICFFPFWKRGSSESSWNPFPRGLCTVFCDEQELLLLLLLVSKGTVVIDYFTWQLFCSDYKWHTDISRGKFLLIYISLKQLMTHVTALMKGLGIELCLHGYRI